MKKNHTLFRKHWLTGYRLVPVFTALLLLFTLPKSAFCEQLLQDEEKQVKGVVKDGTNGEALPGVSIIVKGQNKGTSTDLAGSYSLNVTESDILIFSFVGYLDQEIAVGNQTEINIELKPDIIGLDEIVVVGYGVQKKKLSTGATVNVGEDEISKNHNLRLEQTLQGYTPGVTVTANSGQPGEGMKVRVRGVGTVGNSDPLYIVDGVPTDDVSYLNPSDVESVDILKDAASAAIYGARAANGVVLITTKKGKPGELKVSLDSYYGFQNPVNNMDLLNTEQYMMIMNEVAYNMGDDTIFTPEIIDTIGKGTDWTDYIFNENAKIQNHVLSFTGGNENSAYSASISYFDQEGIIGTQNKSRFERITLRLNSDHKLYNGILTFGENLVYSHENFAGIGIGNIYDNSVRSFLNASPTFPVYDTTWVTDASNLVSDEIYNDGFGKSWIFPFEINPVASMYYGNFNDKTDDKIFGNVFLELEIIKGLKIKTNYGFDLAFRNENGYEPLYYLTRQNFNADGDNMAIQSMERKMTYLWENYTTYSKSIRGHNINVLLGMSVQEYNRYWLRGEKQDLIIDDFDYAIINNGTEEDTRKPEGTKEDEGWISYFGRIFYNYKERYLLSFTLRRDGSSKFGSENRFGTFPSVSAGWVITEEPFINTNWMDFLKIRGSWGQNGNDKIGSFAYEALVSSEGNSYYFGSPNEVLYIGTVPEKVPNPKLRWEKSEQIDIGFDARLFHTVSVNFDWYVKKTKDWLVVSPVPALVGAVEAPTINGGLISNKGVELALGYNNNIGDFRFGIGGNIAFNKNEVLEIPNEEHVIHGETSILYNGSEEFYRAEEGYPVGYFWGY
ncbi:MAG: SusC/RagA family TonB-linked outer membrane protein [Bacteroidales bacterium]|nr:SusC/RagA family TonB-linked outer membrane protein [Bacteroidales bacterium]